MPLMNEDVKYLFQILNAILQEIKDGRAELLQNRPNRPGSEEIYRWQDDGKPETVQPKVEKKRGRPRRKK